MIPTGKQDKTVFTFQEHLLQITRLQKIIKSPKEVYKFIWQSIHAKLKNIFPM